MNPEQWKSWVRSTVIGVGCFFSGWFANKGWMTAEQVSAINAILNSEVGAAVITYFSMMLWGVLVKTNIGLVVSAGNVPEVKTIVVTDPAMAKDANIKSTATVIPTSPPVTTAPSRGT